MTFGFGAVLSLTCTFENEAGVLTDPSSVSLKLRAPTGTITTVTPTKASTGIYKHTFTADHSGDWRYRFEGAGSAVDEGIVSISRSFAE
jgi:hypothetical protein